MQVKQGISQIHVPIPSEFLADVNVYVIQGDKGVTLIDAGWDAPEAIKAIEDGLAEAGAGYKDIELIIATHIHPDHYGLAGRLREQSGAKLALHKADAALLETRYRVVDPLLNEMGRWLRRHGIREEGHLQQLQMASMPMRPHVQPVSPDIPLEGGERFRVGPFDLEIIWTPGHSPGHVCVYDHTTKVLFSGDHVLKEITPNVSLHPQSTDDPLTDFLTSLKQVRQMDVSQVLPAHGSRMDDLKQRIDEILHHHELRMQEILATFRGETLTAYQVAMRMLWTDEKKPLDSMGSQAARAAVNETLAHLKMLVDEGKVAKTETEDLVQFARIG